MPYIKEQKVYQGNPSLGCYQADFTAPLPLPDETFDIMFSFYAGFISQSCKKYLKNQGYLVCNNSHGDAGMAFLDGDYRLAGVIQRKGDRFRITHNDLSAYFIKKDGSPLDKEKMLKTMTGEGFIKKGYAYVFQKLRRQTQPEETRS